ncbi:MAG: hypothetical protein ACYSUT_09880, partial [Planctomycetota bacterium]
PFGSVEHIAIPDYETMWEHLSYYDFERDVLYFQNTSAGGIWSTAFEPDPSDPASFPHLTPNELTIYFIRKDPDVGYMRIMEASRLSPEASFTNERMLSELVATGYNVSGPWLSRDGMRMYYHENDGVKAEIKMAARMDPNEPFVPTEVFSELTGDDSAAVPALSGDELIIIYESYASGSIYTNSKNLWMGVRTTVNDPFTLIRPLDEINSPYHNGNPYLSPDGLTLYFNIRDENVDYNLYKAVRESVDEPFGSVVKLPIDVGLWTGQVYVNDTERMMYFRDSDSIYDGIWRTELVPIQEDCLPR